MGNASEEGITVSSLAPLPTIEPAFKTCKTCSIAKPSGAFRPHRNECRSCTLARPRDRHHHGPFTCERCGVVFMGTKPEQRFCGRRCSKLTCNAQAGLDVKVDWRCEQCGKQELRIPSQAKKRFCSPACMGLAKRTKEARRCLTCGIEFWCIPSYIKAGGGKYCCLACRPKPERTGEMRNCKACGKAFYCHPYNQTHWYCSQQCKGKGRAVSRQTMTCLVCQKSFPMRASEVEQGRGKCCSISCYQIYKFKGSHRVCEVCDKGFYRSPGALKARSSRFCSNECKADYFWQHPEEQHNWKGGQYLRMGKDWRKWSALARKRDKDTCQDCGLQQTVPKLPVHHLKARREFHPDYTHANNLSNLITLCQPCHMHREAAYWRASRISP